MHAGHLQTSLGKRLVIWKVAVQAIGERPILGYGPDSPQRLMDERSKKVGGIRVVYSHFHNIVLNEMVRAGIVGTLALASMLVVPLGLALAAPRDSTAAFGLGLLTCFQATYALSGTVGIMLDHDIMDTQFVAITVLCLYLLFSADAEPAGAHDAALRTGNSAPE